MCFTLSNMKTVPHITIERWKRTRFWAIFVDGELLTVTVYKKGAQVLRDRILQGTL